MKKRIDLSSVEPKKLNRWVVDIEDGCSVYQIQSFRYEIRKQSILNYFYKSKLSLEIIEVEDSSAIKNLLSNNKERKIIFSQINATGEVIQSLEFSGCVISKIRPAEFSYSDNDGVEITEVEFLYDKYKFL